MVSVPTRSLDDIAAGMLALGELAGTRAVAERAASSGWPGNLSLVEGAAFLLYSRGAVDYEP